MPNWKSYESSVRLLSAIIAADPTRKLNYEEISKHFGSDSTPGGIGFQFRAIKADAKRQQEAVNASQDPKDLNIGGKGEGAKPSRAIAQQFGEGTTAKAISMRFERIKKEKAWDLTNPMTGGAEAGTPMKSTPRKRAPKNSAKKAAVEEGDDDETDLGETPSKKKGVLNKTQGGRITKPRANGRGGKAVNYEEKSEEEEEGSSDRTVNVKMEMDNPFSSYSNGHSNGFGHDDGEEGSFYDAEEPNAGDEYI